MNPLKTLNHQFCMQLMATGSCDGVCAVMVLGGGLLPAPTQLYNRCFTGESPSLSVQFSLAAPARMLEPRTHMQSRLPCMPSGTCAGEKQGYQMGMWKDACPACATQ